METEYSFLAYMDENYPDEDFDPKYYKIWTIFDLDGFIESFDHDEFKDLYFWSEFGLRMYVTDLKMNGNTTIDGITYTLATFPFKEIIFGHTMFKEILGEEVTKQILNEIEKVEKAMIKDMIDQRSSN